MKICGQSATFPLHQLPHLEKMIVTPCGYYNIKKKYNTIAVF